MGRPRHFARPPVTKEERRAYHSQLALEIKAKMEGLKASPYKVHKGSGVSYRVVRKILEGRECRWWVVKAVEKYLDAPQDPA